jgi:hypothetical protein
MISMLALGPKFRGVKPCRGSPSLHNNRYRGSFPRGKAWPGREADHSSPLVPKWFVVGQLQLYRPIYRPIKPLYI